MRVMSRSSEVGFPSINQQRSGNPPGMATVTSQPMNGGVRDRELGHEACYCERMGRV